MIHLHPPLSASGLNLARMLGDKFLKQQDARFSAEPYISPVVHIDQASKAFALLARWLCCGSMSSNVSIRNIFHCFRLICHAFLFFFFLFLGGGGNVPDFKYCNWLWYYSGCFNQALFHYSFIAYCLTFSFFLMNCAFYLNCSDGFWDVFSFKKAIQLVVQVLSNFICFSISVFQWCIIFSPEFLSAMDIKWFLFIYLFWVGRWERNTLQIRRTQLRRLLMFCWVKLEHCEQRITPP